MAVHLARTHSSRSRPVRILPAKPLAGWKMRRVIDFIEDNLEGDLSLQAMAAEVDISPLYLARAFKAAVGQSPHQYVLARRTVERAKRTAAQNTDLPVGGGCGVVVGFFVAEPLVALVYPADWCFAGDVSKAKRDLKAFTRV